MTPLGIEPATFRFVAQCWNQVIHEIYEGTQFRVFRSLTLEHKTQRQLTPLLFWIKFSFIF